MADAQERKDLLARRTQLMAMICSREEPPAPGVSSDPDLTSPTTSLAWMQEQVEQIDQELDEKLAVR